MPSTRETRTARKKTPKTVLIGGLAFGIPLAALVLVAIGSPFASWHLFGIRGSILALFACAPLTSLCLLASNRLYQKEQGRGTRQ